MGLINESVIYNKQKISQSELIEKWEEKQRQFG